MATLNTQQKAPVYITDFLGQPVNPTGSLITVEPGGVASWGLGDGFIWLTANAVGECVLTVSKAGSTGTLDVSVTAAPLTLTLGVPEPK